MTMCIRYAVALLALALLAAPARAQTGAPTAWELRLYAQGASTALSTLTVTLAQVLCNQPPTPGAVTPAVNPDLWEWPDVVVTGRVCLFMDTRFQALADGAYEGTFTAINTDGPSAEGPRIPFTRRRPNPPAAVTGGRIIRSATP